MDVVINIHLPNGNNERSIGPSALFSDSILDENLSEQAISSKNLIPSTTKDLLFTPTTTQQFLPPLTEGKRAEMLCLMEFDSTLAKV